MKMSSPSSDLKVFSKINIVAALLFLLLLSTGFSRKVTTTDDDGFAMPPSPFEEGGGKYLYREMIELDYEDAGPNKNRSGFMLPDPDADAPAPQPT
ncbi:hypothetical protein R6Q59_034938 [Mikania micrantha]